MTDREKIRAYIEKLHKEHRGSEGDSIFRRALRTVLFYIDSLQEEPMPKFKVGDHISPIDSCIGSPRNIVDVCDGWYVTDQGTLDFEYEDNWELAEEHKKCMYPKDNYTDEDRKVFCDGCEEECKYAKLDTMLDDALSKETKESWNERLGKEEPVSEEWIEELRTKLDSLSKEDFKKVFDKYAIDFDEEPVSEELEQAIDTYLKSYWGGEKEKQDWPFLKKMAIYFANWQKEQINEVLLSEVLPCFMHGGEADEVVAKLEEMLNKKK